MFARAAKLQCTADVIRSISHASWGDQAAAMSLDLARTDAHPLGANLVGAAATGQMHEL